MIKIAIAVLTSQAVIQAVIEFIKYLIDRHDKQRDSPERKVLRALGADRLEARLKAWKHADVRTADEWENIEHLYEGYRELGGNGSIRKLFEECAEIETTD